MVSAFLFLSVLSEITVVSLLYSEALDENLSSSDSSYKTASSSPVWQDPGEVSKSSLSAWIVSGTSRGQGGNKGERLSLAVLWTVTYTTPLVSSSLGVQLTLGEPGVVFWEKG